MKKKLIITYVCLFICILIIISVKCFKKWINEKDNPVGSINETIVTELYI